MTRVAPAALAVVLVAAVWGVLHVGWYTHGQITDTGEYQMYGDSIVTNRAVPYRDFQVEYPPAALPAFVAPSLLERYGYRRVFQGLMFLCLVGLVLGVGTIAGRRAAVFAAVAPLALGSVVLSRFDLWPAALAVLAVAALVRGRLSISALLLGTAFAAKLWPLALVPVALIWLVRTHGPRAAAGWAAGAAATAAAWFIPFLVVAPGGTVHSFHVQLARPLQLETLGGAILIALHHAAGTTLQLRSSYGSQNLTGSGAHAAAVATTIAGLLALAVVYAVFARGPASVERFVTYAAASVAALVAFGKVFSPQYMIWLIPFVVLVPSLRGVAASVLLFAGLVLTQLWFPSHYWALTRFGAPQSGELLARDLCVLALFAVLAWPGLQHEVLGEHRSRLEALQRVRTQVE
jgi:glycosyl transferase family 87